MLHVDLMFVFACIYLDVNIYFQGEPFELCTGSGIFIGELTLKASIWIAIKIQDCYSVNYWNTCMERKFLQPQQFQRVEKGKIQHL